MSANVYTNMSDSMDLRTESDRCFFVCKQDKASSNHTTWTSVLASCVTARCTAY